jgi:hypothetical protein
LRKAFTLFLFAGIATAIATTVQVQAQDTVRLSGLAFLDYSYVADDPGDATGDNGFGYRRLYLTSDFMAGEDIRFRARIEAADGKDPFIKDLSLRWRNALADGHDLYIGVTAPPAFETSEDFFGYRSLEKTIMDRNRIVSSRDFGVGLRGRLTRGGALRYAVMIGNNNGVKQETDRHKRLYGQLSYQSREQLTVTVGGDFASMADGQATNLNGFIGYRDDRFRIGLEGYTNEREEDDLPDLERTGVSAMLALAVTPVTELVARYDVYEADSESGRFALFGVAMTAREGIRIIPNVLIDEAPGTDGATITARITAHIDL